MKYNLLLFALFLSQICFAQNEILSVVDQMPRFPGCEAVEIPAEEKTACSDKELLRFIYKNIVYPDSAIIHNTEGSVVVRFVVKADGTIGEATLLKDIGHGCGTEAKRVVELMNKENILWTPGKMKGENKDVYFNLPVKFKLEKPAPDYVLIGRDTVYTAYNTAPAYKEGHETLTNFLQNEIRYTKPWTDSCAVGVLACDVLVRNNGEVLILDSYNYANLPEDCIFEAIHLIARTMGKWDMATHSGRPVSAIYPVRITFVPPGKACAKSMEKMKESLATGEAGVLLYNEGKVDEAIAKWTAAIDAFPESVEFKLWRGGAFVEQNNFEGACPDLQDVKTVLGKSGYDHLLPLICR